MGTPAFAVPSLRAVANACDVVGVVTRPDRPRGRGQRPTASPVADEAGTLRLPVTKPEDVGARECEQELRALAPDLFAVVAFGAILDPRLLGVPRLGSINLHGSLLPEYRGASPVQRALWDGRMSTGVTTMWMDEGVDTGDCILQRWVAILPSDNGEVLAARLAELGAPLLAESLRLAHAGRAPRHPQPRHGGSYARRLTKHDGVVNWRLDAETVWNRQRAVTPWPGASTRFRGRSVQLTAAEPLHRMATGAEPGAVIDVAAAGVDVACATGALRIVRLRVEGKPEMPAADWARGARLEPGDAFEAVEVEA